MSIIILAEVVDGRDVLAKLGTDIFMKRRSVIGHRSTAPQMYP